MKRKTGIGRALGGAFKSGASAAWAGSHAVAAPAGGDRFVAKLLAMTVEGAPDRPAHCLLPTAHCPLTAAHCPLTADR